MSVEGFHMPQDLHALSKFENVDTAMLIKLILSLPY